MELLKHLIPILVTISLGLLIVAAGMASGRGQLVSVFLRPRLLFRALVAIDVVPIVAAVTIVSLFAGISPAAKAAIVLMAISPVPPLVPGKAFKLGGHHGYIYGLQTAMALLAIVTVPLLGTLASVWYEADAQFPVSVVASNVFVGLIVPLAIGLALGRWLAPAFSRRAAPMVSQIGNVLVLLAFAPIVVSSWSRIVALVGDGTVIAMVLVVVASLLGGHLLGGPDRGDRATLACAAAIRHPGIALALVGANHGDAGVSAGVLLFMLVGLVVLVPYQLAMRRSMPKAAGQADTPHPA